MKILFIRPGLVMGKAHDALEPLVFAVLKGLTPPDVECRLFDERIEDVPLDEEVDLVALTVETYTARRAYQIAAAYRKRQVPVVMGGVHATLASEEASRHADALALGDAEDTWPQIVEDARVGALKARYESHFPALDGLVMDRSIFAGKRYAAAPLVQFARGCRWNCDFCSIRAFYGRLVRHRPASEVAREVSALDKKYFFFTDDNLFVDRQSALELFEALEPSGKLWGTQVSLDIAQDEYLLERMARAGCKTLLIGFESLVPENLKQMRKSWHGKLQDYEKLIERIRSKGMTVWGSFVFGYDHDTAETIREALEFSIRSKMFLANFNSLAPTPGTPLYQRLKAEGRLHCDPWWLHPDFRYGRSMFQPARLSAEDLEAGCFGARRAFNAYNSIGRRMCDFRANLSTVGNGLLFVMANLGARREIHRKQGLPLGDPEGPVIPWEDCD